jgi:hypothetical protein
MCWNADISINTFIFACLALVFIFYTNTYTKYKTPTFNNSWVYIFFFSLVSMQLVEYFIWKNMKNKLMNILLSRISSVLVAFQPIAIIMIIENTNIRYLLLLSYSLYIFLYSLYKEYFSPINFETTIGKNGHLSWNWMNYKGYENICLFIYLSFYIYALVLTKNILIIYLGCITLFISLFYYYKYNTFSSMWCWIASTFLLYFIINILLIQPFYEYNGLC